MSVTRAIGRRAHNGGGTCDSRCRIDRLGRGWPAKIRWPHETLRRTHRRHPTDLALRRVLRSGSPSSGRSSWRPASVSGYRERPRLSALLDRGLEDRSRLTLLSAPPGYGKTVAVAGWLESRALAHAWLSLDVADNDLARFVRYLVAALRAVRPEVGDATEGLFGPGVSPSIDLIGATLLDEIAASDDPFVLVLDDYQVIGAEPIHRLVRFLIERGPPFAHLVLLTREDPPLPLARLRAHGRLVELRADDLRYTDAEASGYLAEALPAELDPEQLARLLERTEGWIAGLQLAAISLRDRADPGALIRGVRREPAIRLRLPRRRGPRPRSTRTCARSWSGPRSRSGSPSSCAAS